MQRWAIPNEGDRVSIRYRGSRGRVKTRDGIVETVMRHGDMVRLDLGRPWDGTAIEYNPNEENEFGTAIVPAFGYDPDVYQVKVVVPASQVRFPNVEAGDTVKVKQGSTAYRVESVDLGYVTLEDDRSLPVTQITAFDEDVDDYDPFQILPEMWQDTLE